MIIWYLGLFNADESRHISAPSCVVSDKNELYAPSIKTIL